MEANIDEGKMGLDGMMAIADECTELATTISSADKVFVVHGRNHAARDGMYRFLRELELEPITWNEAVALTRKALPTTLEIVKAGLEAAQCTVVLMTGDDSARLRPEYAQEPLMPQPRPNVIFEAGWALAIGGQERTILVRFGGLREFSDISGLNMVELDNSQEKREGLVQRLMAAGCPIRKKNGRHLEPTISGDFSLPMEKDEPNPDVLPRGGFTEFIVDSLLSHSASALDLETDVIAYPKSGASPNLKYSYLGALGAQNWLNFSADPIYGHSEIASALRKIAPEIVDSCKLSGQRVDVVSLGAGDGNLDLMLLNARITGHGSRGRMSYYPLHSTSPAGPARALCNKSPECEAARCIASPHSPPMMIPEQS